MKIGALPDHAESLRSHVVHFHAGVGGAVHCVYASTVTAADWPAPRRRISIGKDGELIGLWIQNPSFPGIGSAEIVEEDEEGAVGKRQQLVAVKKRWQA